jgi:FKBP-type peptidyl-prolyl cis-trans isomerase 2
MRKARAFTRDGIDTSAAMSLFTIFIILLIISGIVAAGYFVLTAPSSDTSVYAVDGDTVKADYVGMFEDGRIFDTSLIFIANDNATFPKALSFQYRPGGYSPIEFTIGTGQMIPGFEKGVLGMKEGDTKTVTIEPMDGYGPSDPSKVQVRDLIEELPIWETMNTTNFNTRFHVEAVEGQSVLDPFWKWNIEVFEIVGSDVTFVHHPFEVGSLIAPYQAWPSKVIQIDSGANGGLGVITIEHLLSQSDENVIKATDATGEFIVVDVDPSAGTFTLDYNREVVGKTLIFHITVVEIVRPI